MGGAQCRSRGTIHGAMFTGMVLQTGGRGFDPSGTKPFRRCAVSLQPKPLSPVLRQIYPVRVQSYQARCANGTRAIFNIS